MAIYISQLVLYEGASTCKTFKDSILLKPFAPSAYRAATVDMFSPCIPSTLHGSLTYIKLLRVLTISSGTLPCYSLVVFSHPPSLLVSSFPVPSTLVDRVEYTTSLNERSYVTGFPGCGMIDWQSPEIQEQCARIFGHAAACLSGVYLWHFLTTWSEVEAKLLFRTIKFSWAFLPYFASRYASAIVMVMVNFVTQESFVNNCEVEAKVISILINLSIASSSTTVLLRPLALWRETKVICYLLYFLSLAHWALGINSTISSISFSEIMKNCTTVVPLGANHDAGIISFYFYTVVFDLTILAFTISGLHQHSVARLSPLWMVLCRQGYAYVGFAAALDIPMLLWYHLSIEG
ncbi:hypothetical protein QCA50_015020 [Cerrena zonata]|uniref:Uncharacterized protein n=1 Tax=Cerrena zonata TaxID=2478898 RepID=A0AAW0FMT0_9APHY